MVYALSVMPSNVVAEIRYDHARERLAEAAVEEPEEPRGHAGREKAGARERERRDHADRAVADLLQELLLVVDDFERALEDLSALFIAPRLERG